jgi:hypothetical protein
MEAERIWITRASLLVVALALFFYLAAPVLFGFPIALDEVARIVQIVLPVFVGYLSAAAAFLTASGSRQSRNANIADEKLLRIVVRGPVYLVSVGLAIVTAVFWYSNRKGAPPGTGMSLDQYCWSLSALLAILTVSTSVVVGRLFLRRA